MDALAGATVVDDPDVYVGRLLATSPHPEVTSRASTSRPGVPTTRGVPLFASTALDPSSDDTTTIKVAEDVAVFTGGAVWCLDWAPTRDSGTHGTRHVAVEARARDDATHAFDSIGDARGPGLVQIVALRTNPKRTATASKKRARREAEDAPSATTASVVLGLAHDARHCFDVKWRRRYESSFSSASALGHLAAALGNARVEVWVVPTPARVPIAPALGRSGGVPIVKCLKAFVGVLPAEHGAALCLDWSSFSPTGRLVAGTSGGYVVLWTVPLEEESRGTFDSMDTGVSDRRASDLHPSPAFPALQIASTGCPQRSVRFAPLDFFRKGCRNAETRDASFLVLAGGHGMASPAVYDTRDAFRACCGSRAGTFTGHAAILSACWSGDSGGAVSGGDDGAVTCHDFFREDRFESPGSKRRGDKPERVSKRALEYGEHPEDLMEAFLRVSSPGITDGEKRPPEPEAKAKAASEAARSPRLRFDRGAVWSVAAKTAFASDARRDVGCALVLAGTGRAGTRIAIVNLGNGLRKTRTKSAGKKKARARGVPVDLTFTGATATWRRGGEFSSRGTSRSNETFVAEPVVEEADAGGTSAFASLLEKSSLERLRDVASRVVVPVSRGSGGIAVAAGGSAVFNDALGTLSGSASSALAQSARYAPVRCVRWLEPEIPFSENPDACWCCWGDDAGFARFQRFDGDSVRVSAAFVVDSSDS